MVHASIGISEAAVAEFGADGEEGFAVEVRRGLGEDVAFFDADVFGGEME